MPRDVEIECSGMWYHVQKHTNAQGLFENIETLRGPEKNRQQYCNTAYVYVYKTQYTPLTENYD
jgi:hypothetical protein